MEWKPMEIGANIAKFRRARGMTQEQLAEQVGVSAPAVSKWENNNAYPDITLLCPLARALGTNVDTLLQFEETLSDERVVEWINAIVQRAMERGDEQGCRQAEQGLEELLHRYPNCVALAYNAVATYDTFQMLCPTAEETVRQRWRGRKRALLERVRASGNGAYWHSATIGLATLELTEGELEKGAALLNELPQRAGDPTPVWALYHLKKGEPEEALKHTQKQLYRLVSQLQTCLTTMANPKLIPPERQRVICRAYQTVAQTFGLPDMSDGLLLETYLQEGALEQAADCFARYVEALTGPAVFPNPDLFAPGLSVACRPEQQTTPKEWRRLLVQAVTEEVQYRPLFEFPAFTAALEQLKASL